MLLKDGGSDDRKQPLCHSAEEESNEPAPAAKEPETLVCYLTKNKLIVDSLINFDKSRTVKVGRDVIDLNSVVGKPHGLFKLTQGSKAKVLNLEPASYILEMKKELLKDATSGESNEKIWDDGTAQQLKKEDIDNLRYYFIFNLH